MKKEFIGEPASTFDMSCQKPNLPGVSAHHFIVRKSGNETAGMTYRGMFTNGAAAETVRQEVADEYRNTQREPGTLGKHDKGIFKAEAETKAQEWLQTTEITFLIPDTTYRPHGQGGKELTHGVDDGATHH